MPVETSVSLVNASMVAAIFRDLPRSVQREVTPVVREAGEVVASAARANASWSTRIPGAITTRVSARNQRATVTVRVDHRKAPHARPYEGIDSRSGTFRVQVFGGPWVNRPTRPFLVPAARANEARAFAMIRRAVHDALISRGAGGI